MVIGTSKMLQKNIWSVFDSFLDSINSPETSDSPETMRKLCLSTKLPQCLWQNVCACDKMVTDTLRILQQNIKRVFDSFIDTKSYNI